MRRAKGEGSLYRKGDLWAGQVDLGTDSSGKRTRKTVYGQTKDDVRKKIHELTNRLSAGDLLDLPKVSMSSFLDTWLAAQKLNLRPKTYDRYSLTLGALKIYLGPIIVSKLTSLNVVQMYQQMTVAGKSADAQHKAGVLLRQVMGYAQQIGIISNNPAKKVPLPRPSRRAIYPLTVDQVQKFLNEAQNDRLFPFYLTALDTGARFGELAALTWADINFNTGEISITKSLSDVRGHFQIKETKSKAGQRRVKVSTTTLEALINLRLMLPDNPTYQQDRLVFTDRSGHYLRLSNVTRRSFRPILKRAGLPQIRIHDLRHTTATLLLSKGVNVKAISERLGHSSIELTLNTYSHVLPTMQEQAATTMDGLLATKPPTPILQLEGPTHAA